MHDLEVDNLMLGYTLLFAIYAFLTTSSMLFSLVVRRKIVFFLIAFPPLAGVVFLYSNLVPRLSGDRHAFDSGCMNLATAICLYCSAQMLAMLFMRRKWLRPEFFGPRDKPLSPRIVRLLWVLAFAITGMIVVLVVCARWYKVHCVG